MAVVDHSTAIPVRLPADKAASLITNGCGEKFNAAKHLKYTAPSKRYTMTELGLDPASRMNENSAPAVIDFAVTEAFPLISPAGVQALRAEVFSNPVQANCGVQITEPDGITPVNHWQLRNPGKYSKFIRDLWSSPETNAAVCDALGYEIIPTMDLEMGHTNFHLPGMGMPKEEDGAVDGIHTDSNCSFVCIVMLSDCADMEGGETAVRIGDGSLLRIKYPAPGYAIILQGLNIWHSATKVTSADAERMTMVTSYQPADYCALQSSVLNGVRFYSNKKQLYAEWAAWRFHVLSRRMTDLVDKVKADREKEVFEYDAVMAQGAELQEFLKITMEEMCEQC